MREFSNQSQLPNIFQKWEVWTRGINSCPTTHFLCRSVKWWRKLFVHVLNMLMLKAFFLHNKFATEKTTHEGFREAVVKNLVEDGIKTCYLTLPPQISQRYEEDLRLSERHYPSFIPVAIGAKRARPCHVSVNLPIVDGVKLSKRWSSYWCSECKKALCFDYCFMAYHTFKDYKTETMKHKLNEMTVGDNVIISKSMGTNYSCCYNGM